MDEYMCWYYNDNGTMTYTYVVAKSHEDALALAKEKDNKMNITQMYGKTYSDTAVYIK